MTVATAVRYGVETPRIWTPELRPLTKRTTRGFEAIQFAEEVIGITLFPWQKWLLIHALELTEDGQRFRFDTVVVLVARQNGKTLVLNVLTLWRMFVDYAGLVIGTAQNLDVAEEAWGAAVDMAEGVPELKAQVEGVDRVNGKKALRLRSSRRYKVQAANRRGGRGLSADLVALDELREHQTWDAWAAVTKTTNARDAAQVWCLSNAGDATSVVLKHLRSKAIAHIKEGHASGIGLFEWSAPDECDVFDVDGLAQANPSMGWKIREQKLRSDAETDPEPLFRTEVMCQWVDTVTHDDVLTGWDAAATTTAPVDPVTLGVSVSADSRTAAVVACGGGVLEVVEYRKGAGVGWVPGRVAELRDRHTVTAVGVAANSPSVSLVAHIPDVEVLTGPQVVTACQSFAQDVNEGRLGHYQPDPDSRSALGVAVPAAVRKLSGDGWRWSLAGSPTDISPLLAAVVARHLWATVDSYDPLANFMPTT